MRKNNWLLFYLIAMTVLTGVLLAGRSSHVSLKNNDSTCCNLQTNECPAKKKDNPPGEMIMESLSRQFLLITPF